MNKITVRLAAVGVILLLGALALALAQHDARQRTHGTAVISKPPAEAPQPIPIDESPLWSSASLDTPPAVVRANDDRMGDAPPALDFKPTEDAAPLPPNIGATQDNPLRGNVSAIADEDPQDGLIENLGEVFDTSSVETASGEGPPSLPGVSAGTPPIAPPSLPSGAPGLLSPPLPPGNTPKAQMPPTSLPSVSPTPGEPSGSNPPPGWLQSAPSLPPSTTPGSTPAAPRPISQSLSDTQRPAMPATSLNGSNAPRNTAGSNPIATRGGDPNWIQAPAAGSNNLPPAIEAPAASNRLNSTNSPTIPEAAPGLPPAATLGAPRVTAPDRGLPSPAAGSMGGVTARTASSAISDSPSAAPFTGTMLGRLISNQPGNRHLDGSQNPIMLIQKRMAGECQVGKRTTVVITVRNAGNSAAQDVEVIDSVPNGASFAESIPAVTPSAEGVLVWKLGEMGPGDERTINLQIVPERQGELGSTAVVRFAAQASMRTLATLPKLELSFNAQPEVLIGSTHAIDVTVKNVGTGVAKAVRLEADLPTHLRHDSGDSILEAEFGNIAPGENKLIRLSTIAAEPGTTTISLRALTEDGVQQEQKVDLRVMAPALEAAITGPNRRYLDRQATFEVMIKNPGTASATNCEFMLRLPSGLNFNTANKSGRYDSAQHAILWSVPEFPAGHAEPVEFTVLPVEIGAQQMTFQGFADLGVKTETRGALSVEEQGELTFSITQDADPIEISSSTTYTVEVRNVGRPDRNVELSLQLPAGSDVLKVDAPVESGVEGDILRFRPIPQMDGRSSIKYRIEVRHGKVGVQIVRAQLKSENRPTLVIKEEATEVYDDR